MQQHRRKLVVIKLTRDVNRVHVRGNTDSSSIRVISGKIARNSFSILVDTQTRNPRRGSDRWSIGLEFSRKLLLRRRINCLITILNCANLLRMHYATNLLAWVQTSSANCKKNLALREHNGHLIAEEEENNFRKLSHAICFDDHLSSSTIIASNSEHQFAKPTEIFQLLKTFWECWNRDLVPLTHCTCIFIACLARSVR